MKKLLFILVLFLFCGCTNYNDINSLAIINEIAIDYNNKYDIYVKVLSSNQQSEDKIYLESCTTLDECFSTLNNKLTKKLYLAHLDLLVLSDNLKENNYKDIISFFLEEESSRNTFKTIIVNKINEGFLKISSQDIENLLDLSITTNGLANSKTFDNIIKDILNYRLSYIPYINVDSEEIEGLKSIYEENKVLDKDSSIAVNFIFNLIDEITLLIDDKSYKLEDCNTTNIIDKNKITIKISCSFKGSNDDKNIINNYLNKIVTNHLNDNSNNYFYYLQDKYGKDGQLIIEKDINISLIKESSGDYFV